MTVTGEIKKKITNITLVVMSIMILIGVGLTIYFLHAGKHVLQINIEQGKTETVWFEDLCLRPGEQASYTLLLNSRYEDAYQLLLHFEDEDPALTLKQYTYVRIERDGEVLCDARLAELFAQEALRVTVDVTDQAKQELTVTYYMPEEIGNEAQNATAAFQLLVTATNE